MSIMSHVIKTCHRFLWDMIEKCCYNNNFKEFSFWGREDEDKRIQGNGDLFSLFNFPFWIYVKENHHIYF